MKDNSVIKDVQHNILCAYNQVEDSNAVTDHVVTEALKRGYLACDNSNGYDDRFKDQKTELETGMILATSTLQGYPVDEVQSNIISDGLDDLFDEHDDVYGGIFDGVKQTRGESLDDYVSLKQELSGVTRTATYAMHERLPQVSDVSFNQEMDTIFGTQRALNNLYDEDMIVPTESDAIDHRNLRTGQGIYDKSKYGDEFYPSTAYDENMLLDVPLENALNALNRIDQKYGSDPKVKSEYDRTESDVDNHKDMMDIVNDTASSSNMTADGLRNYTVAYNELREQRAEPTIETDIDMAEFENDDNDLSIG